MKFRKNAQGSIDSISKETNILPNRLKPAFTSMAAFAKTTGMDTADALDLTSRATKAAADSAAFTINQSMKSPKACSHT